MARLAHVGLLAALGVGGDAGDLVDSKFSPRGCIFISGGVDGLAEGALFGVYIDDLCAILLAPWLRAGISPSVEAGWLWRLMQSMKKKVGRNPLKKPRTIQLIRRCWALPLRAIRVLLL